MNECTLKYIYYIYELLESSSPFDSIMRGRKPVRKVNAVWTWRIWWHVFTSSPRWRFGFSYPTAVRLNRIDGVYYRNNCALGDFMWQNVCHRWRTRTRIACPVFLPPRENIILSDNVMQLVCAPYMYVYVCIDTIIIVYTFIHIWYEWASLNPCNGKKRILSQTRWYALTLPESSVPFCRLVSGMLNILMRHDIHYNFPFFSLWKLFLFSSGGIN